MIWIEKEEERVVNEGVVRSALQEWALLKDEEFTRDVTNGRMPGVIA